MKRSSAGEAQSSSWLVGKRPSGRPPLRRLGPALSLLILAAPLPGAVFEPCSTPVAAETETRRLLLSGTGADAAVDWEFRCSEGRRCGGWTTLPVPSNWELHGFGTYNYGHDQNKAAEVGEYRHPFEVPPSWRGRTVELVFEGSMTDTTARLNDHSLGAPHRGGFYRFRRDVTAFLRWEAQNLLQVEVRKQSLDRSVNRAEREADYWVFGGIYRPVWLRALPGEYLDAVAIDAENGGELRVRVEPRGLAEPATVTACVRDDDGRLLGSPVSVPVDPSRSEVLLSGNFPAARSWSDEHPELYRLELHLSRAGQRLHVARERFGFRTVEIRPHGLFVNGRRTLLRGVNRHAFWPTSGRALSSAIDRRDVELMKAMHLNAVRASHYPPDVSFLEACDELGLYVIDELAGWHDAYATEVGSELVREMVERDRNHPSILFWANGNEGGWNRRLDRLFARWDLQERTVLHPDAVFGGVDTKHYLDWEEIEDRLDPQRWSYRWSALRARLRAEPLPLILPTEVLHGLYDGGSGAGLEDLWERLREHPRGAGAILWSFVDEAVVRTDRGGELDTDGNHAPDGILGPRRETSANADAVRRTFSPVQIEPPVLEGDTEVQLVVENRYAETNLARCRFTWRWLRFPAPQEPVPELAELDGGERAGPPTAPGKRGLLVLPAAPPEADALRVRAFDPSAREILEWVFPRLGARRQARRWLTANGPPLELHEEKGELRVRAGGTDVRFDRATGAAVELVAEGLKIDLGDVGPADGSGVAPRSVRQEPRGAAFVSDVLYVPRSSGGLEQLRWRVEPSGWLRLAYSYRTSGGEPYHGLVLPLPATEIHSVTWLGNGPGRQWANRRQSGVLGVWSRRSANATPAEAGHEPKLRGYRQPVYWARVETTGATMLVIPEVDDVALGFYPPRFPQDARNARAASPAEGLLLLHRMPAIGTKFSTAEELGPQGIPEPEGSSFRGVLWIRLLPAEDAEE